MTERTRVLVLNSPHNPTGRVLEHYELELLAASSAASHDLIAVTDEVYEHLVYDGTPRAAGDAARDGRADGDHLLAGQDPLADRVEDRLGDRAARAHRARAGRQAVPHFAGGTPLQHAAAVGVALPDDEIGARPTRCRASATGWPPACARSASTSAHRRHLLPERGRRPAGPRRRARSCACACRRARAWRPSRCPRSAPPPDGPALAGALRLLQARRGAGRGARASERLGRRWLTGRPSCASCTRPPRSWCWPTSGTRPVRGRSPPSTASGRWPRPAIRSPRPTATRTARTSRWTCTWPPCSGHGRHGAAGLDGLRGGLRRPRGDHAPRHAAGAVGANLEDQMRPLPEAVAAVEAVVAAREAEGTGFVLNARTDAFIFAREPDEETVAEAVERGQAFLAAGAECVFVPRLREPDHIQQLVSELGQRRLSVIAAPGVPPAAELERLGVARVSMGPWSYRVALTALQDVAAGISPGVGCPSTCARTCCPDGRSRVRGVRAGGPRGRQAAPARGLAGGLRRRARPGVPRPRHAGRLSRGAAEVGGGAAQPDAGRAPGRPLRRTPARAAEDPRGGLVDARARSMASAPPARSASGARSSPTATTSR